MEGCAVFNREGFSLHEMWRSCSNTQGGGGGCLVSCWPLKGVRQKERHGCLQRTKTKVVDTKVNYERWDEAQRRGVGDWGREGGGGEGDEKWGPLSPLHSLIPISSRSLPNRFFSPPSLPPLSAPALAYGALMGVGDTRLHPLYIGLLWFKTFTISTACYTDSIFSRTNELWKTELISKSVTSTHLHSAHQSCDGMDTLCH